MHNFSSNFLYECSIINQMYTCPACQKTHDETKFHCNGYPEGDYEYDWERYCQYIWYRDLEHIFPGCNNFFCSLECLKYQDFPEYDECDLKESTDLTFSCCNTCYCAKCHLQLIDLDERLDIFFCDMCKRFFHGIVTCDDDNYKIGCFGWCMCRLCIDLKHGKKKTICPSCHVKRNVKGVVFAHVADVFQYIQLYSLDFSNYSFDFSNCKKFKPIREAFNSYHHMLSNYPLMKIAIETKPKLDILARAWLYCMLVDCKCDCKMCKNVKCNTLLFRLMLQDYYMNSKTNLWDEGYDLTPVKVLYEYASRPDNDCNCEVCQYWKSYN